MKKIAIVVVTVCLAFVAWKSFSTLDAQGFWHASIETPERSVKFDYRVLLGRNVNAWVSIAGAPDQAIDNIDLQRNRIRFDLPIGGRVYHLDGTAVKRKIDGTWRLDNGTTGTWHAERYSLKRG